MFTYFSETSFGIGRGMVVRYLTVISFSYDQYLNMYLLLDLLSCGFFRFRFSKDFIL